jgi:hypothetical protein
MKMIITTKIAHVFDDVSAGSFPEESQKVEPPRRQDAKKNRWIFVFLGVLASWRFHPFSGSAGLGR